MSTPTLTGANLTGLRHLLGASRAEIAALAGVGPDTVRDWEQSRYRPQPYRLAEIRAARRLADRDLADALATAKRGPMQIPRHLERPAAEWWQAIAARATDAAPGVPIEWADPDAAPLEEPTEPAPRAALRRIPKEA